MTRSICLAIFFVLILAGVFLFTSSREVRERQQGNPMVRMLSPRVQVVTPEREGSLSKFQLAISTDPSSLNQMNREAVAVSNRVRPSVVLVKTSYPGDSASRNQKKSAEPASKTFTSTGVLIGKSDEVLAVIPLQINPSEVVVRFPDGNETKADFIGRDDASEVTLLRLPSPAAAKPLEWRNRRSLEWGEHFFALGQDPVHGAQMVRVMVSGDALIFPGDGKGAPRHFRQLDQTLPPDFQGGVLIDGDGLLAGLVIQPDAPEHLRALVLESGAIRVIAEALRSLQKQE